MSCVCVCESVRVNRFESMVCLFMCVCLLGCVWLSVSGCLYICLSFFLSAFVCSFIVSVLSVCVFASFRTCYSNITETHRKQNNSILVDESWSVFSSHFPSWTFARWPFSLRGWRDQQHYIYRVSESEFINFLSIMYKGRRSGNRVPVWPESRLNYVVKKSWAWN